MSFKPIAIQDRHLNSIEKNYTKLNLTAKSHLENTNSVSKNLSNSTIRKLKIPVLHLKNLSSSNDPFNSSKKKLTAPLSTRNIKKNNFSINSPTNKGLRTTRAKIREMFTLPPRPIKYPLSPTKAVDMLKDVLSDMEMLEIHEYSEIYFVGSGAKKNIGDPNVYNYGYDNDKGDFRVVLGDHIDYRYEVVSLLGKGSFGQVCKCFDHKDKEFVAIKIIRNKKRFHKQGLIEVRILEHMNEKDRLDRCNIVKIKNHIFFRGHLCIVFELLSMNLYEFIKTHNFQRINLSFVARFAVQILISLQFSSSLGIIHCDLKPENILLKNPNKSGIKIIDFGSSCYENQRFYNYIQSRFYRAPEIILGIPYTCSIDMWSFACILIEIHIGQPIFPGKNEQEQLLRIMEVLGEPPLEILAQSTRKKNFFDSQGKPRIVPNSRGKMRLPGTRFLQDIISSEDGLFLDFVKAILVWDPKTRLTPIDALNHRWLKKMFKRKNSQSKRHRIIRDVEVDTEKDGM